MNKTQAIKEHLLNYGSLSSWEAIQKYGATRLSAIIFILRHKQGWNIITRDIKFIDRNGTPGTCAEYILVK